MLTILLILITSVFLYIKLIKPYSTWTKRGLKQTNPPYIFGDNVGSILGKQSFYDIIKTTYNLFPNEKYMGLYQMTLPTLMIRDPELIKAMAIKDFDHFVNHRQFLSEDVEPMWNKNLVNMRDGEWKQMRTTLTPSFTSAKMKGIFHLIGDCCEIYVKHFREKKSLTEVDMNNLTVRYTNDVIATVAFGISCDSINEENNEFFKMATRITSGNSRRLAAVLVSTLSHKLYKMLNLSFLPKETTQFFTNIVIETMKMREEKGIVRPDMIHLLMETRKENSLKNGGNQLELTAEDIAAQAFIFFLGGFETVAATIIFMGHVLATHPEIQNRLREEIDETNEEYEGKITYEGLNKMKYLDMVVSETLRKWPSLPLMDRICAKTYTLPPSNETGKPITIYPGEAVIFPIMALHYDSQYFPDPEKFDPERFNDENKGNINPYTYMPFGLGPRNCIGSRLALLEIKMFYFYFLRDFEFIKTSRTEEVLPLNKRSFNMKSESNVWVGIKPRNK